MNKTHLQETECFSGLISRQHLQLMQVKKLQNQNRILIFSQLFTEFSSLVTFFKIFKFISRDATEKTEAWSEQKKASNLSQDQRNQTSKRLKLKNSWIRSRSKSSEVNPEVNKNFVKRRQVKLRLFRSQKKTRQNEVGQKNLWKLVVKSLGKT